MNIKTWLPRAALLSVFFLAACSDDKDSPNIQTGTFVDAPVVNINFQTATQSGVTDSQGRFNFLVGEQVTFSFGSLTLPAVTAKEIVTPIDIARETDSGATINSPIAVNVARLLQSVDADGDPNNDVIEIPSGANPSASIDFGADRATFEAAFAAEFPTETLVSEAQATTHLQEQIDALDTGDGSGGGSVSQFCPSGATATSVSTLPAGLSSVVADLTVTFADSSSPVALDSVANFTFSSSGALFIDNNEVSDAPYQCSGSSEIRWSDSANSLVYAASVLDDVLHEVNVFDETETFLAQYEDVGSTAPSNFNITGSISNADQVTGQWELRVGGTFANDGGLATASNVAFGSAIADGSSYELTVSNTDCSVTNGTGTITGANISNVAIDCSSTTAPATFSVSGVINNDDQISGQWVVSGTKGNDGSLVSSANITFVSGLADGDNYVVTPFGNPASACSVSNGSGVVSGANVTNVVIDCAQDTTVRFNISGTTNGISGSDGSVQLVNGSTGAPLEIISSSAGANSFSFTGVAEDSNYAVVFSNTDSFFCSRNSSAEGILTADVDDAALTCTPQQYAVGGSINGVDSSGGLTLELRAADGSVLSSVSPVNAGFFNFEDTQVNGTAYTVVIMLSPATLNCTISNGSGTIDAASVSNIRLDCVADAIAGISKVQAGNFIDVVFGSDRFVALAEDGPYMSLDGSTWTKASNGGTGSDLAWDEANSQFIIVPGAFPNTLSGGTLFTSSDGLDWLSVSSNQCSAACLGAQFMAVSDGHYVLSTSGAANRQVVISSDLINWTSVDTGVNNTLADVVAFGASGGFVGLSTTGEVAVSSDNGATWGVTANIDTNADLAVNGSLIFSLGQGRSNGFKIDQSSDGSVWDTKLMPISLGAAETLHVGSVFAVGEVAGLFAGNSIESINFLEGVDGLTLNVPKSVKAIAENTGNLVIATKTGLWFGKPVLAGPPKPKFSISGFIDGSGFVNGANQTITVQLLADGVLAGERTNANSYNFSNIEGANYELQISATDNVNVSCAASPSSGAVNDGDSIDAPIRCSAKAPFLNDDGPLFSSGVGISATILGAPYSLVPDVTVATSSAEINFISNQVNIIVSAGSDSWSFTVPNEVGIYTCGENITSTSGGSFTVSLTAFANVLSSYPGTPDSCMIEVLSIGATSIRALFSMSIESSDFPRPDDVIVRDGFFRIE